MIADNSLSDWGGRVIETAEAKLRLVSVCGNHLQVFHDGRKSISIRYCTSMLQPDHSLSPVYHLHPLSLFDMS